MSRVSGRPSPKRRLTRTHATRLVLLATAFLAPRAPLPAEQGALARIVSEHIGMRIPLEREWLGRDSISDLEQCWRYVNGVTGDSLPRKLLIQIEWEATDTRLNTADSSISVGMGSPAAQAAPKRFLLRSAAREMALVGLAQMSRGGALRPEVRALTEGMAEILAHEYDHSARALSAVWPLAHMLDRIGPLSLAGLADWRAGPGASRDLRAAAPAITFLLSCLELQGRDRTLRLFEAMKKGSLEGAIVAAFRVRSTLLEESWLEKVRASGPAENITVTSEEDAPVLRQTSAQAEARPGTTLELRLAIEDAGRDLSPGSVFVVDEHSGHVVEGRAPSEKGAAFTRVDLPIEEQRRPGKYTLRILAVDDAGNLRQWSRTYVVQP